MSRLISIGTVGGLFLAGLGACTAPPSATDLNPDGPPMVRQVMMTEEYLDSQMTRRTRPLQLAFGTHDDVAFVSDDHTVVTAAADPTGQAIRVVMDELLVGNNLELIQCRAKVDLTQPLAGQSYARVPLGTNPDDVANCSGPNELIARRCVGEHAVCINNTGVNQTTDIDPIAIIAPGQPVGIEDIVPNLDGDGVPDHNRFIDGSVRILCKGADGKSVEAPINLTKSYWQPSGNQQVPAHGGVAELGPALVLFLDLGLPTSTQCTFSFDPSVVDKDGNRVCASPDGDIHQACKGDGDTSLVSFGVAGLRLETTQPNDNTPGVPKTRRIAIAFNTSMSVDALQSGVTITENGTAVPFTVAQEKDTNGNLLLKYDLLVRGGITLAGGASYVVSVGATVADFAGEPLGTPDASRCPAPISGSASPPCTFAFTTVP